MGHHLTPATVASVLARYAPKRINALLDPAVGTGSLLRPFMTRKGLPKRITCVDRDETVVKLLPAEIVHNLGSQLDFVRADFLVWARKQIALNRTFDCIIVNPPFCGRKGIRLSHIGQNLGKAQVRKAPIELVFLVKCIELLASGGRLLAILPSSAVTCVGTRWFREFMLSQGSIARVHEIAPNTFSGVEGRIYLLVFDKDRRRDWVMLCNSDLMRPSKIRLQVSAAASNLRFDYSFHKAMAGQRSNAAAALPRKSPVEWMPLAQMAEIVRGNVEAPFKCKVLHTTDRSGPFWASRSRQKCSDISLVAAVPNDVLVARVGRECANSVGLYCSEKRVTVSDCVLVVRPRDPRSGAELLFAIRVLLKGSSSSALLERGTGASYITIESLSSLEVPSNLHVSFPRHFGLYARAIRARRANWMLKIELIVAKAIGIRG